MSEDAQNNEDKQNSTAQTNTTQGHANCLYNLTITFFNRLYSGHIEQVPKSADYISLINMGDPQFLFQNGKDILGSSILQSYNSANKAAKFVFNKSIDDLLFSWMGEEIGVFEVKQSDVPIFFVSLKDEKLCRQALELIYSSFFVKHDDGFCRP